MLIYNIHESLGLHMSSKIFYFLFYLKMKHMRRVTT